MPTDRPIQPLRVNDALAIGTRVAPSASVELVRTIKGRFELVAPQVETVGAVAAPPFACIQQFLHEQSRTFVRTEFQKRSSAIPPAHDPAPSVSPRVEIDAAIEVVFSFNNDELSEEDRAVFSKVQSVLVAWPFWREFHQTAANRMGLDVTPEHLMTAAAAARCAGYGQNDGVPATKK